MPLNNCKCSAFSRTPVVSSHCKFNRQTRRLESSVSPTKQTPAPQINRQQMRTVQSRVICGSATSRIRHPSISNRHHTQHDAPALTRQSSRIARHCRSNRRIPRLENAISRRKQTLGTRSNRHFLQVSESHQPRIAAADCPPQVASNIVSNRQSQILEIAVNLSKQTIAPRSNRHKNAFIKSPTSSRNYSSQVPEYGSGSTDRSSPLTSQFTGEGVRLQLRC